MKQLKHYFNGHTEFIVGIVALLCYVAFWGFCVIFHIPPLEFSYIIKPMFGLFAATMIMTVIWFIFEKGYSAYKHFIDSDEKHVNEELTKWQQTKLAFWFFALYAILAAFIASQL